MTIFGPNVVSFTITAWQKQWYVVGAYILPKDQPVVHRLEQALAHVPEEVETLLVEDLNACLEQTRDQREENLENDIANHGLVY